MKRLLPHILIALAVHAVVLRTDPSWLVEPPRNRVTSKSITLSISTGNPRDQAAPGAASREEPPEPSPPKPAEASPPSPVAAPVTAQPGEDKPLVPQPAAAAATSESPLKQPAAQKDARKPNPKPPAAEPAATKPAAANKSERPIEKLAPPKGGTQPAHKITPQRSTPKPVPEKQAPPAPKTTPQASNRQSASPKSDGGDAAKSARPQERGNLVPSPAVAAVRDTLATGSPPAGPIIKEAIPMYQINPPPKYPRRARRMGLEGRVMLEVLISAKGQVDDLRVLQSSGHKVLDRAALSAVRKWRFEPGTQDGRKNKMWVRIPIHFDLQ